MILLRVEGVEERKEEFETAACEFGSFEHREPTAPRIRRKTYAEDIADEQEHGSPAHVDRSTNEVFGMFENAMKAVAVFLQGQTCPVGGAFCDSKQTHHQPENPPLSVAEALNEIEQKELGAFYPETTTRSCPGVITGVPEFLGEESVRSIEEDNISAISQETLEGIEKRNNYFLQRIMGKKKKEIQPMAPGCERNSRTTRRNSMGFSARMLRPKHERKSSM